MSGLIEPPQKGLNILRVEEGLDKIIYKDVNPTIHALLILSILWRLTASSFKAFKEFSLSDKEVEVTRQTLLQRTDISYAKFLDLNENIINLSFSYVLITSHHDKINLKKGLFIHPNCTNPYYIILGEYILFANFNDMHWDNNFRGFFNYKRDDVVISRWKSEAWEETINLLYSKFRDSSWYHLRKNNKKPHKSRINNNSTQ